MMTSGASPVISLANQLKLYYHLSIAKYKNGKPQILINFVRSCLHVYEASLRYDFQLPSTDRMPGDDVAILAASSLIHLYKTGYSSALVQSIVVLEILLSHSKHNYDALLLLTRLYMFVGAGTLAMERYERLTVKNLQYSTVMWVLFTRISHIHPQPATISLNGQDEISFDPLLAARHALRWHVDATKRNLKSLRSQLNNERWEDTINCIENDHIIRRGFNGVLTLTQYRNLKRFRTSFHDLDDQMPPVIPYRITENRDRTAFPNYEPPDQPTFENILPRADGEIDINDRWIALQLNKAYFWDVLHNNGDSNINPLQLEALWNSSAPLPENLIQEEQISERSIQLLKKLYQCFVQPSSGGGIQNEIQECCSKIQGSVQAMFKTVHETILPNLEGSLIDCTLSKNWAVLHQCYSVLEYVQFTTRTLDECINANEKRRCTDEDWLDAESTDIL